MTDRALRRAGFTPSLVAGIGWRGAGRSPASARAAILELFPTPPPPPLVTVSVRP